jgi:hypothetical protein
LSNNTATWQGGGIASWDSDLIISDSAIIDNHATGDGGGIYTNDSELAVTNVTVSGNHSGSLGGGFAFGRDTWGFVTFSTIAFNTADSDGGGIHDRSIGASTSHSIIANNQATGIGNDYAGRLVGTGGYNLVQDPDEASVRMTLPTDIWFVDPLLAPLRFNGTSTPSHALLNGSPAIDRGGGIRQVLSASVSEVKWGGLDTAFVSSDDLTGNNPDNREQVFIREAYGSILQVTDHQDSSNVFSMDTSFFHVYPDLVFSSDSNALGDNADQNGELFLYSDENGISQITNTVGGEGVAEVSFVPNSGSVVFTSDRDHTGDNADLNRELFLYHTFDGLTQITNTIGADNTQPNASLFGSQNSYDAIVFRSTADFVGLNDDGNEEIFLLDAAGTYTQLTNTLDGTSTDPQVSYSGSSVVFSSSADLVGTNADRNQEVYLYDTSGLQQLTNTQNAINQLPKFFGDGVVFQSTANFNGENPAGQNELFSLSGAEFTLLSIGGVTGPYDLTASGELVFAGSTAFLNDVPPADAVFILSATHTTDQNGHDRAVDGDDDGNPRPDIGAVEAHVHPSVLDVQVNYGLKHNDSFKGPQPTTWQIQQSQIKNITITFSEWVDVTPDEFQLTNLGVNTPVTPETVVELSSQNVEVQDNVVKLEFDMSELVNGVYRLEILPEAEDSEGNQLDGNRDGLGGDQFSIVGDSENRLLVLRGEFNGDDGVSVFDFGTTAYWFGSAVGDNANDAPSYVDVDNDNGIGIFDWTYFINHFEDTVVFPVATAERVVNFNAAENNRQGDSEIHQEASDTFELELLREWSPARNVRARVELENDSEVDDLAGDFVINELLPKAF